MAELIEKESRLMERLTYRDSDGRALLTNKGMKTYCSTQATADILCKYEESLSYESVPVDFMREYIQRDGMSIHDISVINQMYEAYKEIKSHEQSAHQI